MARSSSDSIEFGPTWLDRVVGFVSPLAGLKRAQARAVLASYEAATPSRLRKYRRDQSGPNVLAQKGAIALRTQMRYLERNHDLTKGSLDVLVNNTVGPNGIGVEFQPRRRDGSIHEQYAQQLADAFELWQRKPEVTGRRDWQNVQRIVARTKFRDGECFAQQVLGPVATLEHGSAVPYSLELFEPDLVPFDYSDESKGILQGCERNEWGRIRAWHVHKRHPGEFLSQLPTLGDLKRIPAERVIQVADLQRLGQLRGITPYASVINRIEDIKDYEESERIAAKVAAMLTAYIKKIAPTDEGYTPDIDPETGQPRKRQLSLAPGTILDNMAVGEEIGLVDTSRPNVNLVHFRNGQLRAFAAGIAASYSSLSRNYEGTYSAQRQELVESFVHYAVHTDDFIGQFSRLVVETFVLTAHLSGVVKRPADLLPGSEFDVLYIAPAMPWIDPAKEALAWLTLVQAGFASELEVIRKRGQSPEALLEQVALWRKKCADKNLNFNSDAGMAMLLKQQADDEKAAPEDRAQARAMLALLKAGAPASSLAAPVNVKVDVAAPAPAPPQPAPVNHFHIDVAQPPAAAAPQVTLEHHTHVDVQAAPAPNVTLEAAIDVKPSDVVVQPAAPVDTVQDFTRDEDGELKRVVTKHVAPTSH